jgi:cell division protein FtsZ
MGKAMMGTGEATGEDRALMAAQNAIQNPLLDEVSLKGAKAVLVNVTGGYDMTLLEVDEAANAISAEVDDDANIIFGAAFDPELEGKIRVAVVATGMEGSAQHATDPRRSAGQAFGQARAPQPMPQPAPQPQPLRPAAFTPVPEFAAQPAPEPLPVAAAEPAPVQAPAPAPVWNEPKRAAFAAEYDLAPAAEAAPTPAPAAPAPQADLYGEPVRAEAAPQPQTPSQPQRPAPAPLEPEPMTAEVESDAPLFPERNYADRRRSGFMGLFGGRARPAAEEPPAAPSYRQAPTRGATALQAQPEEEPLDASDDLEIPSFLRRLAN